MCVCLFSNHRIVIWDFSVFKLKGKLLFGEKELAYVVTDTSATRADIHNVTDAYIQTENGGT